MSCVLVNDFRVTFLQNGIIRIEKAVKGEFLDGNTFFVPARPAEVECARTEQPCRHAQALFLQELLKSLAEDAPDAP